MLIEIMFVDPYESTIVLIMHKRYVMSKLYIQVLDSVFCHKPFSRQKYNVSS